MLYCALLWESTQMENVEPLMVKNNATIEAEI